MKSENRIGIGILMIILAAAMIGAAISNQSPENNYWTNNVAVDFTFDLDTYENKTCGLIIDQAETQNQAAQATNTFTETLSEGVHTWQINCTDGNQTETGVEQTINVDLTDPTTSISYPVNNTDYENATYALFTANDNLASTFNCSIDINGNQQSIDVTNGTQNNVSTNPQTGSNTLSVSCEDIAGNSASEVITFTITPEPEFLLELESTFNIGEQALMQITAEDNANITIDVYEKYPGGFMAYYGTLSYSQQNYPRVEVMPYTNVAGDYAIYAEMQYGDTIKTQTLNFTVNNNIVIDIDGDTSITEGDTTELSATVTGGISPYTYYWVLSDGTTSTSSEVELDYDEPGDYTNTLTVTDAHGNEKVKVVEVDVREILKLTVIIQDDATNTVVKDANVKIDGESKKTNSEGIVIFLLSRGYYDIYITHVNYALLIEEDYHLKKNVTTALAITRVDNQNPEVTLVKPTDGTEIIDSSMEVVFKVEDDASKVICEVYTKPESEDWYEKKETLEVTTTAEQKTTIEGFELGNYDLKVECKDPNNNKGVSPEVSVSFVDKITAANLESKIELLNKLYDLLDSLPQQTVQQKQVAEALELENNIKLAIKTVERTARDISNLEFRRDLNDDEKEEKQQELLNKIDDIFKETPVEINVLKSNSFVKYIEEEELKPIIDEYASIQGYADKKNYLKAVIETQKEATITTSVKTVELGYLDGTSKTITLVTKDISYVNDSQNFKLLEYIPKELAESVDDLTVMQDFKIVKNDPILEFKKISKIVYYIEGQISLKQFERANTIILPDSYIEALTSVTGASILGGNLDLEPKTMLVFLIIVLTLVYVGHSITAFDRIKTGYVFLFGDKRVHTMNLLVNDSMDNLEVGDLDKAQLIYREVKLYYDNLPTISKNQVYDSIISLCEKLDYSYAELLMKRINSELTEGSNSNAKHQYNKLRLVYKKLDKEDKKRIYSNVQNVAGKIAG